MIYLFGFIAFFLAQNLLSDETKANKRLHIQG